MGALQAVATRLHRPLQGCVRGVEPGWILPPLCCIEIIKNDSFSRLQYLRWSRFSTFFLTGFPCLPGGLQKPPHCPGGRPAPVAAFPAPWLSPARQGVPASSQARARCSGSAPARGAGAAEAPQKIAEAQRHTPVHDSPPAPVQRAGMPAEHVSKTRAAGAGCAWAGVHFEGLFHVRSKGLRVQVEAGCLPVRRTCQTMRSAAVLRPVPERCLAKPPAGPTTSAMP